MKVKSLGSYYVYRCKEVKKLFGVGGGVGGLKLEYGKFINRLFLEYRLNYFLRYVYR